MSFGISSYYIIKKTIENSLRNNLTLCRTLRDNVDHFLSGNINRLYDISLSGTINLSKMTDPLQMEALKRAYYYSIFKEGIFIVDRKGNIKISYPDRPYERFVNTLSIEPIQRAIRLQRPVISNIYTIEPSMKKVIFVLVPLRDNNGNIAAIGGNEIDPTSPFFYNILKLEGSAEERDIEIIDSNGIVIASSNRGRIFKYDDHNNFIRETIAGKKEDVTTCHDCHSERIRTANIITIVPSRIAPWAIVLREKKEHVSSVSWNSSRHS